MENITENVLTKEEIDAFVDAANNHSVIDVTVFGRPIKITVLNHIGVDKRMNIADSVKSMCIDDSGMIPMTFALAFRFAIALNYTNLFEVVKDVDINTIDYIVSCADLWIPITDKIEDDLYEIECEARDYIKYLCGKSKWDDLYDTVNELVSEVSKKVENMHMLDSDDLNKISTLVDFIGKADSPESVAKIIDFETVKGRIADDPPKKEDNH